MAGAYGFSQLVVNMFYLGLAAGGSSSRNSVASQPPSLLWLSRAWQKEASFVLTSVGLQVGGQSISSQRGFPRGPPHEVPFSRRPNCLWFPSIHGVTLV